MRIDYLRTGGMAGGTLEAHVDTDMLPPNDARELEQMVVDANFFVLPREMSRSRDQPARRGGTVPDDFHHEITVERGHQRHTVEVDDQLLPPSLEPLIDYLVDAAITQAEQARRDNQE